MKKKTDNNPLEDIIVLKVKQVDHDCYKRFDHFLAKKIPHLSRSFIKNLFKKDLIYFTDDSPTENKKLELKKMPPIGSIINVEVPPPVPADAQPEDIPLDILYEDDHLVFVNKNAGLVTHPAPGNYTGTLVNAVLFHCPDIQGIGDQKRPGIVHRLDKGTSGIMVVAKTQSCHEGLISLFSTHKIERIYEAIVLGTKIPKKGTLTSTIGRHRTNRLKMAVNVRGGRQAITHFKSLKYYKNFTHVELKLETGRTHQIRAHLSYLLNGPILMDPLYGNPSGHLKRLGDRYNSVLKNYLHPLLHAKTLGLVHPITKENLRFEVPPPPVFQKTLSLGSEELIDE